MENRSFLEDLAGSAGLCSGDHLVLKIRFSKRKLKSFILEEFFLKSAIIHSKIFRKFLQISHIPER